MPLNTKVKAYKALAKAYFEAKCNLDAIIDMNALLIRTQEEKDIFDFELRLLEKKEGNISNSLGDKNAPII